MYAILVILVDERTESKREGQRNISIATETAVEFWVDEEISKRGIGS